MEPENVKTTPWTPSTVVLTVLALSALAIVLATIALWPRLDQPLVIFVLLPAAAAAGAAAMMALNQAGGLNVASAELSAVAAAKTSTTFGWQDLIAAMPNPAIVLDAESNILNYNSAAESVFERLRRGIAIERVLRDPELIAAITDALRDGTATTANLVPRGTPARHLIALVAPLARGSATPKGVLITIRDLSEQHRLLEMRSDFIANASHELRTPLASVRGFIETLQGPARNDEAARSRFLAIMAEQAERMTRLIDDLLLLSRVEERANLKPTGRVDLVPLIEDVVRSLEPIADERDMTIELAQPDAPHIVAGDRDELFQVFQNLIENAVKYGKTGGRVDVRLNIDRTVQGGRAKPRSITSIADDGPGITPDHLPRLTERFYRVNAEHSRTIGGTGLGLAIVKHILNRHDGELRVESVVGRGTTFQVVLTTLK